MLMAQDGEAIGIEYGKRTGRFSARVADRTRCRNRRGWPASGDVAEVPGRGWGWRRLCVALEQGDGFRSAESKMPPGVSWGHASFAFWCWPSGR